MSFDGLIAVVGILAAAMWLMWGFSRISAAWTAVQKRVQELDQKRIEMARGLMTIGEELIRLKRDEKETGDKLAGLRAQVAAKTKEMAEFVPPPAQEILVSSEYPSTRDDKAWIVAVARSNGGDTARRRQYLVWASDQAGAQNRARTVLADQASGYEIAAVQRYA
jgi:hypothetical protein